MNREKYTKKTWCFIKLYQIDSDSVKKVKELYEYLQFYIDLN